MPQAEVGASSGEEEDEESARVRVRESPRVRESAEFSRVREREEVESPRESAGREDVDSVRPMGIIAPAKSNGGTCSRARIQSSWIPQGRGRF